MREAARFRGGVEWDCGMRTFVVPSIVADGHVENL
jgi:hypothetical protein